MVKNNFNNFSSLDRLQRLAELNGQTDNEVIKRYVTPDDLKDIIDFINNTVKATKLSLQKEIKDARTASTTTVYQHKQKVDLANDVYGVLPSANGGGGGGSSSSYRTSFTNASLSGGVLTVTHSLNITVVTVSVYDNNNKLVYPDSVTLVNSTSLTIDLTNFGTLSGTWNVVVNG